MSYNRGDVVLVRFPHTNLRRYSKRPALVVQDENVNTGLGQRIIVLITGNTGRTGQSRVFVQQNSLQGQEMGILNDSVIVTDNITTVLNREIDRPIGRCELAMPAVEAALRSILRL